MRKKLLANIQWRAMRMTAGLSLLLCAVFITLMLLYYGLDPMLLFLPAGSVFRLWSSCFWRLFRPD